MAKPQISIPLDIDNVNVLKVETIPNGAIHISLESSLNYGYCRKCGQKLTKLHGYDAWVKVQHLPSFGHAVFLHYRPKRYECCDCDGKPTTTQQLAWHEPNSPHTKAYDGHLLRCLINSTVQDVSTKERLSYDAVEGVLERCLAQQVDWTRYQRLGVLGIDEITRLKGHGDFITVISARLPNGELTLLGVLANRKKETVKAFLETIPQSCARPFGASAVTCTKAICRLCMRCCPQRARSLTAFTSPNCIGRLPTRSARLNSNAYARRCPRKLISNSRAVCGLSARMRTP